MDSIIASEFDTTQAVETIKGISLTQKVKEVLLNMAELEFAKYRGRHFKSAEMKIAAELRSYINQFETARAEQDSSDEEGDPAEPEDPEECELHVPHFCPET
eukprot:gene4805-5873_t